MITEQLKALAQFAPVDRDDLRAVLAAVPGVKLHSSHHGTFAAGELRAELARPTASELHVTAWLSQAVPAPQALETTARLPANLRFATLSERTALVANMLTQPHDQLHDSFTEMARGLALAAGQSVAQVTPPAREETFTTQQIVDSLRPLGWEPDAVVELAAGWELRPKVTRRSVAVKFTADGGNLRLQHVIVARLADAQCAAAVCDQSLRLNGQLRHARLALASGQIVAESCLRGGQFHGAQLANAARAVASAAHHARSVLDILNTHAEIAACYAAMFCCDAVRDEPIVAG